MNIKNCNWKINTVSKSGGDYIFHLSGYLLQSQTTGTLVVNGNPLDAKIVQVSSSDVPFSPKCKDVFCWQAECVVDSAFVSSDQNILSFFSGGCFFPIQSWSTNSRSGLILPDEKNIKRVSGQLSNKTTYRNSGHTEYLRYLDLFGRYCPETRMGNLLDWGIGCGRVAQHFALDGHYTVAGADIDAVNIEWCQSNIANINSQLVPLEPPTNLLSNFFDIIISSSVLSHLIPTHWEGWLNELKRITKFDTGTLFLSFHGDNSSSIMLSENKNAQLGLRNDGWYNLNASIDLGPDLQEYYRNTFFSDAYARELFEKEFRVIDVVPGILSGSQSVAVLKTK